MAKTIKFSGQIQAIESVGAIVEINRVFEYTEDLTDAVCYYYDIPSGTTDHPIAFTGMVDTVKLIYVKPSVAVTAKLEDTGSTAFPLSPGVSVFYGPLTALFVTTTSADVKVDIIVFG